ncbi:hypothetical protein KBC75_03615 [Candidatus Shapirobacteria bacterium]|nr:hypothetical protein [Candidatus Shapirobacteria bacterium]
MKKFFCFILTSYFLLLTSIQPSLAYDPLIVQKPDFTAPPTDKDINEYPNYYANDIDSIDTVKCLEQATIQQSFEPKEVGGSAVTTSPSGTTTVTQTRSFIPYDIKKIDGTFTLNKFYSNLDVDLAIRQLANHPREINDPTGIKRAFLSLDSDNPTYGASNSPKRTLPYTVQKCLRSQRLVLATRFRGLGGDSTTQDELIACKNDGQFISAFEGKSVGNCQEKIFLSDVAVALDQNHFVSPLLGTTLPDGSLEPGSCGIGTSEYPFFYNPDDNCFATDPTNKDNPPPIVHLNLNELVGAPSARTSLTPLEACKLYKTAVEPAGEISSASSKIRWAQEKINATKDDAGDEVNSSYTHKKINFPGAGVFVGKQVQHLYTMPYQQPVTPLDACLSQPNLNSLNKPNAVTFKQVITGLFDTVRDKAIHILYPHVRYTFIIDQRIPENQATGETANRNLITGADQEKYYPTDWKPSSTVGNPEVVHPGNPLSRALVKQNLLPKSWQL